MAEGRKKRTTQVMARIEPEIKEQVDEILKQLGLSASDAINLFYRQIIAERGIPFALTLRKSCKEDEHAK